MTSDIIRSKNLPFSPGKAVKLPDILDCPDSRERWEKRLNDGSVPKVIDLFCGAGGLSAGFVNAGFAVTAALDNEPPAVETFAANIPGKTICTDILAIEDPDTILEDLDFSSIDVISGGPPCQGFSIAGRSRIRSLKSANQVRLFTRNELYQDFFRFVEAFKPSFFLLENVVGLLSFADGAYIEAIEKESERLGYVIDTRIVDAVDHGVPQFRRRLFVIGSRVGRLFRWPRALPEQDRVNLHDAIGDLPTVLPPSKEECLPYNLEKIGSYYQQLMRSQVKKEDRHIVYDHVVRPVREDDRIIFMNMKPGDRYIDIDPRYRRYDDTQFKDKYFMLDPEKPGNTITAHIAKDGYRHIHWDASQHRTLSVREAARIQSFGDYYRFSGFRTSRFRQIGNAVPPLLAEQLAVQMYRAWRRARGIFEPHDILQPSLPISELERYSHLVDYGE